MESLARFQKSVDATAAEVKALKDKLAKLKGAIVKTDAGYLEVTISGKAGEYEFELKETDLTGKELGTVVVRDTTANAVMLAKLLTRAKADPTAPKELRMVAQPQTSHGLGSHAALRACDAAGYKTVKFTGYVIAGGFTPELKPDQKGDVLGYTRYEGAEKKPAELITEIEEGMRRF